MNKATLQKAREVIRDPDIITGMYDHIILWISKKMEKRTGYTMKDLENKNVTDYFQYGKKEVMKLILNISFKKSGSFNVRVLLKSGKKVIFKVKFCKLKYEDKYYHVAKILN
jgi:PAS domain S-box-containing protein